MLWQAKWPHSRTGPNPTESHSPTVTAWWCGPSHGRGRSRSSKWAGSVHTNQPRPVTTYDLAYDRWVPADDYPYEAERRVTALIEALEPMAKADSEQEIRGVAVPVLEATLEVLRETLAEDPVAGAVVSAYEHGIATGEPVRVVDALLVARQIDAAIGPYPISIA